MTISTSPQDPENDEILRKAMDLAEKRLREGTASSEETVHFLRLGGIHEKDV